MNQQQLNSKLEEIKDKVITIERTAGNRIYLPCEAENSYAVNKFLFEDVPLRFVIATGIDSDDCFEILYHYAYDPIGCVVTVKAFIRDRENPAIESIAPFLLWIMTLFAKSPSCGSKNLYARLILSESTLAL